MRFFSSITILMLGLLVCRCVTPINPDARSLPPSLVVDGLVTDQPGRNRVSLSLTAAYKQTALNLLVQNASVTVSDDANRRVEFRETSPGYYQPDTSWRGVAGRTYTLNIQLSDGRSYRSKPELLRPVVPIDTVYVEFTQKLRPGTQSYNKGFDVYLDLKDPATPDDYYRWSWVHYERPYFCGTVKIPECSGCQNFIEYGVLCCGPCWDIIRYQNEINIASDNSINGNRISRRPLTRVPFTSYLPYYLEIEQQSLTKEAYQYLFTLNDMISNSGGLFDAAPATLTGNLSSTGNAEELVFGYFAASAMVIKPFYVDRRNAPAFPDLMDLPPALPSPAPCTACVESPFRTQHPPKWWQF
ncbi:DUF4249 domain-containing protein [Larkinella soli]|uniref:DUF4249 domain-containing protein n=1 Tax=Larkinella soli TaxID=1770527 RepID=UPI000FFBE148|nr:DUF4249 domain-containing protein [Larkinella soli]